MSVHLVGGGSSGEHREQVYRRFATEAAARARSRGARAALITVVVVAEGGDAGATKINQFADILTGLTEVEVRGVAVTEGDLAPATSVADSDALLVGGGLTPAYLQALAGMKQDIAAMVGGGMPYLGFSAGAAIAAERALVGGWRDGGVAVCAEDNAEDLDELTVVDGLGLVPFTVDVHAAQWGSVSRLVSAVARFGLDRGVAIDEDTALVINRGAATVHGGGQVWWAEPVGAAVGVRAERAAG